MGAVRLDRPKEDVAHLIGEAVADGERLLADAPRDEASIAQFRERYLGWEKKTEAVLDSSFDVSGFMTPSPKSEFLGTAMSLLDLKIPGTPIPLGRVPEVEGDIREKLRVLRSVAERLDLFTPPQPSRAPQPLSPSAPIFLVHGHDIARRETVRRFLETVTDRTVVVLADQPNRGQDILGKLLAHAQEACFAVVLLTPDDVGGPAEGGQQPRARQNVVFELGLFIGLLGRERVVSLNARTIDIPTDFSGVGYVPIEGEAWQMELARELKAAGLSVSLDKAL